MELLGLDVATIALFVGFGLPVGVLFGFFGMGGSFLVTPALLVSGYPVRVAVGSGLAFVFGTSVVGALRHRDHGQIDYKLAALTIVGLTVGIEAGTRAFLSLDALESAELVVSVSYTGLLALVGAFTLYDTRRGGNGSVEIDLAARVRAIRFPPTVTLAGDRRVSAWVVLSVGGVVGILSGFLGVGGGFLLLPAMVYGFGVPVAVAVGTDILQISVSSAYGTFVYAEAGAVALPAVGSLLAGSAFGARVGAGATTFVDEEAAKGYFSVVLLAGSLSVAAKQLGGHFGIGLLDTVSIALVFGAPTVVTAAIVLAAVRRLRRAGSYGTSVP